MSISRNNQPEQGNRDQGGLNRTEKKSSVPNDLPDSRQDSERLEAEEVYIDLPDVKDIPGQEFVNAPPAGMMADTTISSDDEEGRGIFEEETDEDEISRTGNEADVSPSERKALERADYMPSQDEDNLRRAALDSTDNAGDRLNEKSFGEETSGSDLDIPGTDDEGETDDEENEHYSLGSSDNDNVTEGTP